MTVEQTRFLGSSVVSVNSSLGWNGDSSNCEIHLVDDPDQNDRFTEPAMGTPAYFSLGDFTYNGWVADWSQSRGQGGNPEYRVTIGDVREFLAGTVIIIDDYQRSVHDVPNLLNAFGFLENSVGFGGSQVNEGGMPWYTIATAVQSMMLSPTTYGGPLNFYGYEYIVNLLNLPSVPLYYRIPGSSITLLDFIDDVCHAGNCDYFLDLYIDDSGNRVIRVNVVNRNYTPTLGSINRFVSGIDGAISKNVGYESRREATGRFVNGGQKQSLNISYGQRYYYGDLTSDIFPFWGFDKDGYAIGGEIVWDSLNERYVYGVDDDYTFTVDSRHLQVAGTVDTYKISVQELRAAARGETSWKFFMTLFGNQLGTLQKAVALNMVGPFRENILEFLSGKLSFDKLMSFNILEFANFSVRNLTASNDPGDPTEENISRLFKFVEAYALEYYGKKWAVKIPFVYVATEAETNKTRLSQEPCDFGFLDETEWDNAIGLNLIPWEFDRLQQGDGRFQSYVRFDDVEGLDFSQINPDDIILNERMTQYGLRRYAFVKCVVDQKVYFTDPYTKLVPFVVIDLPAPVYKRPVDILEKSNIWAGIIRKLIVEHDRNNSLGFSEDQIQRLLKRWISNPGTSFISAGKGNEAYTPAMAAVPLKSNIECYGPWYAAGANGKVEYEKDDSLVPWNYNGYSGMNLVGESKVALALLEQQTAEYGSVNIPGLPKHSLGQALIDGGPYVTDITVSAGPQGLTTDYNMRTWSPQFGRLVKSRVDSITRISKTARDNRRGVRLDIINTPQPKPRFRNVTIGPSRGKRGGGGAVFAVGSVQGDIEDGFTSSVAFESCDTALVIPADGYEQKAVASMDALFVPFSTNPDAEDIPHFESPGDDVSDDEITSQTLNPFGEEHHMTVVSNGEELPDDLVNDNDQDPNSYRSIALRAPLILSGWGYDTDGKPVPNENEDEPTDAFLENHRRRLDMWKTGPVDIRWNNEKKCWVAGTGGSSDNKIFKTLSVIEPLHTSLLNTYTVSIGDDGLVELTLNEDEQFRVLNFRNVSIAANTYYVGNKVDDYYVIDNQSTWLPESQD